MRAWMKVLFIFLGTLSMVCPAFAGETVVSVDFFKEDLSFRAFEGHDVIDLRECTWDGEIGAPGLPVLKSYVAIPGNMHAFKAAVLDITWEVLPGLYDIYPQQIPLRISGTEIHPFQKNNAIYSSSSLYPREVVKLGQQGDLGGVCLVGVTVYPLVYSPLEGKLLFLSHVEFAVYTEEGWESREGRHDLDEDSASRLEKQVRALVLNPQDVRVNSLPGRLGDPQKDRDYVILSPSSLAGSWETLRTWKEKKGLNAVTVTTEWIQSQYGSGAEGIRSFVEWAVSNWGTEYFLLGGDTNLVPCHVKYLMGDSIPNDTFYADYDEDWLCEVAVGRASVTTGSQADALTTKILNYEKNCPASFAQKAGLYGFDLDGSTHGQNALDYISSSYIPYSWTRDRVYDSHSGNHKTEATNSINDGQNLINHIDHCFYGSIGVGSHNHGWSLSRSDISAFSNGAGKPGVFNSIGCWPGAMDYDCCAERWIENGNGGGWAALMNTRYGWYAPGKYDSLSMLLQRHFNRSFFSEGIYPIGYANNDSKNDFIATAGMYEWYIFAEMTLFGDPETFIWKWDPKPLEVTHEDTLVTGHQGFTVNVKKGGSNLSDALVCIMKGSEVYDFGNTNSNGNKTFYINPATAGTMDVTVTCPPDAEPYEGIVTVVPGTPDPPSITEVNPAQGHTGGGTRVTVTGENFTTPSDTHVYFGGIEATGVQLQSSSLLTCRTPGHPAGQVDVTVSTSYGSDTLLSGFEYEDYPPQVSSVEPGHGAPGGGTFVTVSGKFFVEGTEVFFDSVLAGSISVVNSSTITCLTPAGNGPGSVHVTVLNFFGTDVLEDGYTYDPPPPVINTINPDSGPNIGGYEVTISGQNFCSVTSVLFGLSGALVVYADDSTILCVTPFYDGTGFVDVSVYTQYGEDTAVNGYSYFHQDPIPPEIYSVIPDSGPVTGGTEVTFSGANFTSSADTRIGFGILPATDVHVLSSTTLTCTTPARFAGSVDIWLSNSMGECCFENGFTYVDAPTVNEVSPNYGHILGGYEVTITGSNFSTSGDTEVTFGGIVAGNIHVLSTDRLTCTTPAHVEGEVTVAVVNRYGLGEKLSAFSFLDRAVLYYLGGNPIQGQPLALRAVSPNRPNQGVILVANNHLGYKWFGNPYNFGLDMELNGIRVLYNSITQANSKLNDDGYLTIVVKYPGLGGPVDRFQLIVGTLSPVDLESSNYLDF